MVSEESLSLPLSLFWVEDLMTLSEVERERTLENHV